ncbi:FAD-dependent monooxygenase [Fodinicola acaciae]|uniref:FAD-dependent monooxygenase n=1 Tax=Fodinicola acaciae TaxID=2681555 RepID=UPI0013D74072|nr:FAD-dependent monooxygenase [Fodinicola acaciae]
MSFDVVISGGGPVGLLLAIELRLNGLAPVVIERLTEPDQTIKAGALHAITGEALVRRGLRDQLAAAQLTSIKQMLRMFSGDDEDMSDAEAEAAMRKFAGKAPMGHFAGVFKLDGSRLANVGIPESGSPPLIMVPQPLLEAALVERAVALGVELRRGHNLTGLVQDDDGVTVTVDGPDGAYELRAGYLVGCDGGRSTVRKLTGFDFPGTDPAITGHQALAVLADPEKLPRGWNRTPTGMLVYGPMPERVLTVEFDGPPADRDGAVTVEELQASLRHVSGTDVTVKEIISATRFTDNARAASSYRNNRVLLAGDAAHVHSPFGGQGLTLGLGDALNLGWKLAAVVRGQAGDDLLDTYTAERHPVALRVLANTRAQIALMAPGDHTTALRDLFIELMDLDDVNQYLLEMVGGFGIRYDVGDDHSRAGRFFFDIALTVDGSHVRFADFCQDGQAVLLDLADSADVRAAAAGWPSVRVVRATTDELPDLAAVLVRPDGYVAWALAPGVAFDASTLTAALTRWLGAAAVHQPA